ASDEPGASATGGVSAAAARIASDEPGASAAGGEPAGACSVAGAAGASTDGGGGATCSAGGVGAGGADSFVNSSVMMSSVSREAVPLPSAITVTWYLRINSSSLINAS